MSYQQSFSRNLGLVSPKEQEIMRTACIAVAGVGGVGGTHALTLARMGFGKFHLADFDVFDIPNINRQQGAFHSTLGKPKVEVIKSLILDINPEAEVTIFKEGIKPENIDQFLQGVNAVADGIDFYALEVRRLLFSKAREKNIPVVTSGPIAFTATLQVFTGNSMSFEEYFDFASCPNEEHRLASFMAGTAPAYLNRGQFGRDSMSYDQRRAPSVATAISICGGIVATQIFILVTGRKCHLVAPQYLQFDPLNGRMAKGKLRWGNRGPIQKIKRQICLKLLRGMKTPDAKTK